MTITYSCPNCGACKLEVQVHTVVDFTFDQSTGEFETDDAGRDREFTDLSAVVCSNCGHSGRMAEFKHVAGPDGISNQDLANLLTDAVGADVWTDAEECQQRIGIIQDAMAEAAHRLTLPELPAICKQWLADELNDAEFAAELRKHLKAI
jgi:hypothetical protein